MTCASTHADSDSVNLGSNPSSPATRSADVSGSSHAPSASDKSEIPEQTAHAGRTEVGTARYRVIEYKGWSYVVGPDAGPWRYQWEAQEEADRLNVAHPVGP